MSASDAETEARDVARRTDDELRAVLFQRLLDRLKAEQRQDPTIVLFDRKPYVFSLSRHGNKLTVDQGHTERFGQPWRDRGEGAFGDRVFA